MNLAMLLVATLVAQEPLPVAPVKITPGTRLILQRDLQFKYGGSPVTTDGVVLQMWSIDDIDDIIYPRHGSNTAIIRAGSVYVVERVVNNSPDPNFFVMGLICRSHRRFKIGMELPSLDTTTVDANAIIGMFKVVPAVPLAVPDKSVIQPEPRRSGSY